MTDHPETLRRYRLPLRRDRKKQAAELAAPAMRYVPKNPLFYIGAALVGVAGFFAWKNRDRISAAAGPLIEDARAKGQALMEEAAAKSQELMEDARAKGEAAAEKVAEKVSSVRRAAADRIAPTDIH